MKIINWIGAAAILLAGLFFVNRARVHQQRADRLQEARVVELRKNKTSSLKKADKLGKKIRLSMDKAAAAKVKSNQRMKKLEERDETSLADRVRDFNNSL